MSNSNNPKISIIIPCYNSEKWIEKSVKSALNQNGEFAEVIVVDNESTDNSLQIIKNIQKDFIKSKYYECVKDNKKHTKRK